MTAPDATKSRRTLWILLSLVLAVPGCTMRDLWQRPETLVDALEIAPGDTVADIGAGDGYFLAYLAAAVGATGTVYAVEVDADKVIALEALVADLGLENVEVVLAGFDDPELPDGTIDLALLVDTYHHLDDRPRYFANVRVRDLASGGRVVVIEPDRERGGVIGLFIKEAHSSTTADVQAEMREAGFTSSASRDLLPVQIFEIFEPAAP